MRTGTLADTVNGTVEWSSEDGLCWLTEKEFVAQTLTPQGRQNTLTWTNVLDIDLRDGFVSHYDHLDYEPGELEDSEFYGECLSNILRWPDGQYVRIVSDESGDYFEFKIKTRVRFWMKCAWEMGRTVRTVCWASRDKNVVDLIKDRLTAAILRKRKDQARHLLEVREEKRESAQRLARRQYMAQFSRRAKQIYQDSRKTDRRYGRSHALSLETIDKLLKNNCAYCGVKPDGVLMTLDRIDIALGHTDANVKPSCYECNLTRADMPYEAWIQHVAPGMRKARKSGLLDNWRRTNKRNKNKVRYAEPKARPPKPEGEFRLVQGEKAVGS